MERASQPGNHGSSLPRLSEHYDPTPWAAHTDVSDPGPYRDRLADVGSDLSALSAASRNLVVHYRASGHALPAETQEDPNNRWMRVILERDHERHGGQPLSIEREPARRVQGCCRDHSLVVVAGLREQGIPARLRYGFAEYLYPGHGTDHAIVELWNHAQRRWQRCDPEFGEPVPGLPHPEDQAAGPEAPFRTAAEVWIAYRSGTTDPMRYLIAPEVPIRGPWLIHTAVLRDAAFRARHEVLLWDVWEGMSGPEGPTPEEADLADAVAALTVAADAGDEAAEQRLLEMVSEDPRLTPPAVVTTLSPWSDQPSLTDRTRIGP